MNEIIAGRVVRGAGYGKQLGFPTANIDRRDYVRRKLSIRQGIWAGLVELPNGKTYKSGIVIGPTDHLALPKLEAYLIGFKGTLYGKKLIFYLKKFLRPFRPYTSEALLKKQISQDIHKIKKMPL